MWNERHEESREKEQEDGVNGSVDDGTGGQEGSDRCE